MNSKRLVSNGGDARAVHSLNWLINENDGVHLDEMSVMIWGR